MRFTTNTNRSAPKVVQTELSHGLNNARRFFDFSSVSVKKKPKTSKPAARKRVSSNDKAELLDQLLRGEITLDQLKPEAQAAQVEPRTKSSKLKMICMECGRRFKLNLKNNPFGECPDCGSSDTDAA